MNGSNFNLSSLLCSHGNKSGLEEPKVHFQVVFNQSSLATYALSKQFQEIESQSKCIFWWDIITWKTCSTPTSFFELLACLTPGFQGHEQHRWRRKWKITPNSVRFDTTFMCWTRVVHGGSLARFTNWKNRESQITDVKILFSRITK